MSIQVNGVQKDPSGGVYPESILSVDISSTDNAQVYIKRTDDGSSLICGDIPEKFSVAHVTDGAGLRGGTLVWGATRSSSGYTATDTQSAEIRFYSYVSSLGESVLKINARSGSIGDAFSFFPGTSTVASFTGKQNLVVGCSTIDGALTTTATDGFLYLRTCPGVPTGTPTAYTGRAPVIVDSSNHKIYVYSGSSWKQAGGGETPHNPSVCDGRLTLTSATPITTADVTGASTLYFTPYYGNHVAMYDGSQWEEHSFSELSLSLSGLTSGKNYDVFLVRSAGSFSLSLSTAWTDDVTRADALATQDGVRVLDSDKTKRLVGTIRTTGTTTTEDSEVKRFVRNERHPVARKLKYEQGGTTWTYNSSTWRRANNNAAAEVYALTSGTDLVQVNYWIRVNQSSAVARIGVGVDSLTPVSEAMSWSHESGYNHIRATSTTYPAEGYHYWPAVESVETTGTAGYAANGYIVGEVMA